MKAGVAPPAAAGSAAGAGPSSSASAEHHTHSELRVRCEDGTVPRHPTLALSPSATPTPTLTLTRCGHCKAMKPAWNEFSKLHAKSTELLVGEVDCTAAGGEELCERFEVEGFPTLKFFEAGASPEPEPGPRPQLRP